MSGCVDTFYNIVVRVMNEFTPVKTVKSRNHPRWFSRNTLCLLQEKYKYHKRWKKYGNPYDYQRFSDLRSDCRLSIDSDYSSYIFNSENSLIQSPRRFWSYVHSNKNETSDPPSTIRWENKSSTNHQEAAEIFASYFKSVYSQKPFQPPPFKIFMVLTWTRYRQITMTSTCKSSMMIPLLGLMASHPFS